MVTLPVLTEVFGVKGPPQGHWTRTDWEKLADDGNRYEIIDGVLYMSTAPSSFHQWIIWQFAMLVGAPAHQQGLAYAFFAPIGVFMPGCDPIQPDFVVVLQEHAAIIHDRRIWGVPDLIVEVLSPGNIAYDEDVKKTAYSTAGVPEYGIVDPRHRQFKLYQQNPNGEYPETPRLFSEADTVIFNVLPGIAFKVGDLFAGAPDTSL